jgi:DNA-binding CsgD family transcriptional regulator
MHKTPRTGSKKELLKNKQNEEHERQFFSKDILLNSLSAPIFVYNHEQKKFIYVNKDFAELIGCSVEECYQNGPYIFTRLIEPHDQQMLRSDIQIKLFDKIHKLVHKKIFRLSYSVNFRLQRDGKYDHIVQQVTAIEWTKHKSPLVTFNMLTNVTDRQKDHKMILSINVFDENKQMWKNVLSEEFYRKPTMLSDREQEIMKMMLQEATAKAISDKLNISFYTARAHMRNILEKTSCKSREMLKKMAIQEGWA